MNSLKIFLLFNPRVSSSQGKMVDSFANHFLKNQSQEQLFYSTLIDKYKPAEKFKFLNEVK